MIILRTSVDKDIPVATVLTVYGIETVEGRQGPPYNYGLQQCLPFTVLKPKLEAKYSILRSCNSAYRLRY